MFIRSLYVAGWIITAVILVCFQCKTVEAAEDYAHHECTRKCVTGSPPKTCRYDLVIETYATMSKACYQCPFSTTDCLREDCIPADGWPRLVLVVNRQLPGPQLRVCQNDAVVVKFTNKMDNGEGTSIHFHGVHMKGTVSMDGVAMITQCPILPSESFTYKFKASKAGTQYYHAHVGSQRGDGIAGAFIVRPLSPRTDILPHRDEPEHTIIVQDWFRALASGKGVLHLARPSVHNNSAASIIVNGIAPNRVSSRVITPTTRSPSKHASAVPPETFEEIPPAVFNVHPGTVYRFRVISNAVMNCPIEVYIDGHLLVVIASDGADIESQHADIVVVAGGERWDFLIDAKGKTDNYWMYFRGIADCNVQGLAILHYHGAMSPDDWRRTKVKQPNAYNERPDLPTVNPFMGKVNPIPKKTNLISLTDINSSEASPGWLTESKGVKLAHKYYLLLGLHKLDNPLYNIPKLYPCWSADGRTASADCTVLAQINYVNGKFPSSPYLHQYSDIKQDEFGYGDCLNETYREQNFCQYINRIKLSLGDVVELVLIDRAKYWNVSNHPMHIHGQYLHVLGMGQDESLTITKQQVIDMDNAGKIKRNYDTPILKDTIMMPVGGYVVTRFKADNPGPWLFHCHNELHVEQGMFMVFEVGDPQSWPKNSNNQSICGPHENDRVTTTGSDYKSLAIGLGSGWGASVFVFIVIIACLVVKWILPLRRKVKEHEGILNNHE